MVKGLDFGGRLIGCLSLGGAGVLCLAEEIRAQQVRECVQTVSVLVGTNDLARGRSLIDLVVDYTELLLVIQEKFPNARVFCMNILPRADRRMARRILSANAFLRELVSDFGYHFVDCLHDFTLGCRDCVNLALYGRGRLHLSGQGKWVLADIILHHIDFIL